MAFEYAPDYAVGDRFIAERLRLGLTRKELAERLEVSIKELEVYKSGRAPMSSALLRKLHDMGVDVLYVMIGVRQPETAPNGGNQVSISDNNAIGDIDNSTTINHYYS